MWYCLFDVSGWETITYKYILHLFCFHRPASVRPLPAMTDDYYGLEHSCFHVEIIPIKFLKFLDK
jgi:hypothetical protein